MIQCLFLFIFIYFYLSIYLFFRKAGRMNVNFDDHPADPNYGEDRLQLFNVESPLTFSVQEFEGKWREVDNVWTQLGATKQLKNYSGWTTAGQETQSLLQKEHRYASGEAKENKHSRSR